MIACFTTFSDTKGVGEEGYRVQCARPIDELLLITIITFSMSSHCCMKIGSLEPILSTSSY